jgi:Tfp pilus assembly protein PilZ
MKKLTHKTRRRYFRHPAAVPVVCHRGEHSELYAGEMRDISLGGLSFETTQDCEAGDTMTLVFPSLEGRKLSGQVVWAGPMGTESPPRHACGIRFLDDRMFSHARMLEQICNIEAYRQSQSTASGRDLGFPQAAREWIGKTAQRFPR